MHAPNCAGSTQHDHCGAGLAADPRRAAADVAPDAIDRNRLLVAATDRMSLEICWGVGEETRIPDVPTAGVGRTELRVRSRQGDPADLVLDPWPFAADRVDVIAFTSSPQVRRLFAVAKAANREAELHAALRSTTIAAVGPVVAGELQRRGLRVAVTPAGTYFMKPLVSAIEAASQASNRHE